MSTDQIISEHSVLTTCGIFSIERDYGGFGGRICTFSVDLRDGKNAWMKMSLRHDSDKWIVIVRKRPVLDVWARSRQERQLSTGDESAWRDDYKFHHAEKGFSHGRANPVQLAWCDAHYEMDRGLPVLHTGFYRWHHAHHLASGQRRRNISCQRVLREKRPSSFPGRWRQKDTAGISRISAVAIIMRCGKNRSLLNDRNITE